MRKTIFITLISFFSILSLSAQLETNTEAQKTMTYEEAVRLLTAFDDEFNEKGEAPEFPTLGKQIANARNKKNVSLSTLAYVSGLSEEVISKIEGDRITPTRDILAKIEDFLGEEIVLMDN